MKHLNGRARAAQSAFGLVFLVSCQTLSGLDDLHDRRVGTAGAGGAAGAAGAGRGGAGVSGASVGGASVGGASVGEVAGASAGGAAGASAGGAAGSSGEVTHGTGGAGAGGSADAGASGQCPDTVCGNECVDLKENIKHCGACNRECSTDGVALRVCDDGVCVPQCDLEMVDCSRPATESADDGCETDRSGNVDNCGECGRPCANVNVYERRCERGLCTSTCAPGWENVNLPEKTDDDGCELNIATDPNNCGASRHRCGDAHVSDRVCTGGVCTPICNPGAADFNLPEQSSTDDGCEASCPPAAGGPDLVMLPEEYCIDSTEVTQAQYQEWLGGTPPPSTDGQVTACDWNTSYDPDTSPTCNWEPATKPDYPVVCVDWCDAYAYCQAVDKRLCGNRIEGANGYSAFKDASRSQWYNACVSGEVDNLYPYGDYYAVNTCNGTDHGLSAAVQVKSMPYCRSSSAYYGGVYDLSGNVREWENSCSDAADQDDRSDACRIRGGAYSDVSNGLACDSDVSIRRDTRSPNVGFRCCVR